MGTAIETLQSQNTARNTLLKYNKTFTNSHNHREIHIKNTHYTDYILYLNITHHQYVVVYPSKLGTKTHHIERA